MPKCLELRIPGPTPLPPEVELALARPMINHRSAEFRRLLLSVQERLQQVAGLPEEVVVLTASGTGGLEAAVANTIQAGDRVLSVSIGHFGDRFAEIARRFGAQVDRLGFDAGCRADPRLVQERLRTGSYRAVLLTHSETSTGVLNDLVPLSEALDVARERPLLLVDGVSSLGAVPVAAERVRADVFITASQKAWMAPPGLAMLWVSERAWQRIEGCPSPRLYLDLAVARRYAKRGETPWTPALPQLYALDAALDLILQEGVAQVRARHQRLASRFREGLRKAGLELLAQEEWASPTVTAAWLPEAISFEQVSARLESEHNVHVAGGQGELKGKVLRVGHMGYIGDDSVDYLLHAIAETIAFVRQNRETA